jgi:hypothetical protein
MANFTTLAYFKSGLTNIPNLTNDTIAQALVNAAIATHEPRFLKELFGYEFYKGLQAYKDVVTPTANPIYDNLINGTEYTDSFGRLQKTDKLAELCSNYIMFFLLSENVTTWNGIGEYHPQTENGAIIAPAARMSSIWNRLVDTCVNVYNYIDANKLDYQLIVNYGGSANLTEKINKYGF